MKPEQRMLVQTSFEKVLPIADTAAALFYSRLFALNPGLKMMFKGDMQEQGRKLMTMLKVAVSSLDRLDQLVPAVQKLGERHATYGVQAEHYEAVGAALLWTLEQGLGDAFTPATREAWATVYVLLANTMKEAARKAEAQLVQV